MIRCRECDHSNPEDHRFCGMCGANLEATHRPQAIDEDDPLELETPVYQFEDHSHLRGQLEVKQRDRQREQVRDTSSIRSNGRGARRVPDVETLPHEIIEPTVESEYGRGNPRESAGIGGPSFLGLNYEAESNRGFVYDKPRQDGFVYDSDGPAPEYLLEEIPRGVSWRAWALFLLLIIGGGLGYIQWRASHHQGPDLASILARNGPTVDPSGPVIPDKSAKPAAKINSGDNNSNTTNAKDNAQSAENKNAAASPDGDNDEDSSVIDANAPAAKSDDTKTATAKTATKNDGAKAEGDAEKVSDTANAKSATKNSDGDDEEKSAKPESDGPVSKSAKAAHKTEVADEEPPQPKTLGEKDPLIVQADKYIQGRGVRKNCSTGINLLRQAVSEGNPAASVKLGALYWSGTCVTQSKVTAYQWFSRAHSMEPKNRWIERSRNSLWASMSPAEQRRVTY
jgi:hypothetical protein